MPVSECSSRANLSLPYTNSSLPHPPFSKRTQRHLSLSPPRQLRPPRLRRIAVLRLLQVQADCRSADSPCFPSGCPLVGYPTLSLPFSTRSPFSGDQHITFSPLFRLFATGCPLVGPPCSHATLVYTGPFTQASQTQTRALVLLQFVRHQAAHSAELALLTGGAARSCTRLVSCAPLRERNRSSRDCSTRSQTAASAAARGKQRNYNIGDGAATLDASLFMCSWRSWRSSLPPCDGLGPSCRRARFAQHWRMLSRRPHP
jgi:hypothetical protein